MPLDQSQVAKIDQPISSAQRIQPTHILQQKCLNKWVASAPRKATLQLSTPYTRPCPSNLLIYYIYSILCLSSTVHIVAFVNLLLKKMVVVVVDLALLIRHGDARERALLYRCGDWRTIGYFSVTTGLLVDFSIWVDPLAHACMDMPAWRITWRRWLRLDCYADNHVAG